MSVVHGVFSLYDKNSPSVVVYSILQPPSVDHPEFLSENSVHETVEEEWGEYAALPDYTDNLELFKCSFGGPDLATCVGVHCTNDVDKITGHLVIPQDGNEGITIY